MLSQNGTMHGIAHGRRQDVKLRLEPDETMNAPGLAGITIETASGHAIVAGPRLGRADARGARTARAASRSGR